VDCDQEVPLKPATPFPVQALAPIVMGLGSGIFWSPLSIAIIGSWSMSYGMSSG